MYVIKWIVLICLHITIDNNSGSNIWLGYLSLRMLALKPLSFYMNTKTAIEQPELQVLLFFLKKFKILIILFD